MNGVDAVVITLALLLQGPGIGGDARDMASQHNALLGAGGVVLAAGAYVAADDLRSELDGPMHGPSRLTDVYGGSSFNLPASLSIWALGEVGNKKGLRDLGADLTRTMTLTQFAVAPVKLATRRRRPDGSNHRSFPSGHTANAFAAARLIQRKYDMRWAWPLYILGACTGAGRVAGGHHYVSDVVMGAATGIIVGSSVKLRGGVAAHTGTGRVTIVPKVTPGGGSVRLAMRL